MLRWKDIFGAPWSPICHSAGEFCMLEKVKVQKKKVSLVLSKSEVLP